MASLIFTNITVTAAAAAPATAASCCLQQTAAVQPYIMLGRAASTYAFNDNKEPPGK
jgi:hypothetical protein